MPVVPPGGDVRGGLLDFNSENDTGLSSFPLRCVCCQSAALPDVARRRFKAASRVGLAAQETLARATQRRRRSASLTLARPPRQGVELRQAVRTRELYAIGQLCEGNATPRPKWQLI